MESMIKKQLLILILLNVGFVRAQYSDAVLRAFEKSYAFEKERDFEQASAHLSAVYQADSYEFNIRLGWLEYNIGRFQKSIGYYRKALHLLPYSEEARFGLILPLSARGEWDEVAQLYREVLANSPGNTRALYHLGLIHYERREWTQAARFFQKVVDLYPFDFDGLHMLAWTNLRLGKTREAKVLFNKALLWSPNNVSVREGLELLK